MRQLTTKLSGGILLAFSFMLATAYASDTSATKATEGKKKEVKAEDKASDNPVVEMKTNHGVIKIELDAKKAPVSTKNFLSYIEDKFYDNTVFHRVIDGFMIQGGGFGLNEDKIEQKQTKTAIINEGRNGLKNTRGSIAMARTNDPNSATSQFFINVSDNATLDYPNPDGHGYAVFGRVTEGMEVVDKIRAVRTGMRQIMSRGPDGSLRQTPFNDVPMENVVVESIRVVKPASKI